MLIALPANRQAWHSENAINVVRCSEQLLNTAVAIRHEKAGIDRFVKDDDPGMR